MFSIVRIVAALLGGSIALASPFTVSAQVPPKAVAYDGPWQGTLSCSEGAGPFANLKPFSSPVTVPVAGYQGIARFDNDDKYETLVLAIDDRGLARVQLTGARRTESERRNWSIIAEGKLNGAGFKATAPMFRIDKKTLVRGSCTFELKNEQFAARLAALPSVAPTKTAPPSVPKAAASVSPAAPVLAAKPALEPHESNRVATPPDKPSAEPRTIGPVPAPEATTAPSTPADTTRLIFTGTKDAKRLRKLVEFLAAKDATLSKRQVPPDELKQLNAQEADTALAAMSSYSALSLSIYLDKQAPTYKRDLAGAESLGDGQHPIDVLLIDIGTRVPQRSLLASATVALGYATDPPNPLKGPSDYLTLVSDRLREELADAKIALRGPPKTATQQVDFNFILGDWQTGSERALAAIGQGAPLILAYNIVVDPASGAEVVMFRQSDNAAENIKTKDGFTRIVRQLRAKLDPARFEPIAVINPEWLAHARFQRLNAAQTDADRRRQTLNDRIARIDAAATAGEELAGTLRVSGKTGAPPTGFCTVKSDKAATLMGLIRSPEFLAWAAFPGGEGFTQVLDTADELYAAMTAGKCAIIADYAPNLKKYMAAIGRDGQFLYNVGTTMNRQEAREPLARAAGFDNWSDYAFSQQIGDATPKEIARLREASIADTAAFSIATRRMADSRYSAAPSQSASGLLAFLDDEAEGKKVGKTAVEFRTAEKQRLDAEARSEEAEAAKHAAEYAKDYPFVAVLTCGMGNGHINILACFAAQASHSVDTELKLTNGTSSAMFKAYNLSKAGTERRDGFRIDLKEHFSLVAQNSHDTLILSLTVTDRISGKVLYQNQAAKFGVLSVGN